MQILLAPQADGVARIDALRTYVHGWGLWAPAVYVLVVIVEVLIAPIPGTLLYAPAGAIWGGLMGGTLSLAGNVTGATIACWLSGTFGERFASLGGPAGRLATLRARLQARGAWLIFLLRLNPLTSSDLVSYAAGLAGVPPRQVFIGTLAGMIPHCYAQSFLAEALFRVLPSGPLAIVFLLACATVVAFMLLRK
jgi:uncharacterized membrane protein YdjX (TVP38/TMEM64 family)